MTKTPLQPEDAILVDFQPVFGKVLWLICPVEPTRQSNISGDDGIVIRVRMGRHVATFKFTVT
jgi:hypothetical protein